MLRSLKGRAAGGGWGKSRKGGEDSKPKLRDKRKGQNHGGHALALHEEMDEGLAAERASVVWAQKQNGEAAKRKSRKRSRGDADEEDGAAEPVLGPELTAKILREARKQQQEVARELERDTGLEATQAAFDMAAAVVRAAEGRDTPAAGSAAAGRKQQLQKPLDSSDEEEEREGEEREEEDWDGDGKGEGRGKRDEGQGGSEGEEEAGSPFGGFSDTASQYQDYARDITEEEERAIALFLAPASEAPRQWTLADVIRKKIEAQQLNEDKDGSWRPGSMPDLSPEMQTKVEAVYRGVGELLSRYTAGKLPKAFKLIPSLSNWEQTLQLTSPETWTAPAMFAATRLFASNLNSRMAQRFFRLVLLPRVRRDIKDHKRLHFALYQSLKKALYKPAAFFKGILLPICQSQTCTLREAVIVGSVIQKVSIPVLHSSVALLRIAEMPYAGTNSYFMKLFFDKKYALPYRVVDAVVTHFARFADDARSLPVIWHQSLLSFVQRYKEELTCDQKEGLRSFISRQNHYLMSSEILRELNSSSRSRGDKAPETATPGFGFVSEMNSQRGAKKARFEELKDLPAVVIGMEED